MGPTRQDLAEQPRKLTAFRILELLPVFIQTSNLVQLGWWLQSHPLADKWTGCLNACPMH
jgi:hypothetical protein